MFCDIYGNKCFDNAMNDVSIEEDCECPMECNSISYSFSLVSNPFNPEEMCPNINKKGDYVMKEFYNKKFPPQFIRRLIQLKNNVSSDAQDYCKNNLQYRAEVTFKMATDSIDVTVMSRRLSFFDMVSAFGKNKNNLPYPGQ